MPKYIFIFSQNLFAYFIYLLGITMNDTYLFAQPISLCISTCLQNFCPALGDCIRTKGQYGQWTIRTTDNGQYGQGTNGQRTMETTDNGHRT